MLAVPMQKHMKNIILLAVKNATDNHDSPTYFEAMKGPYREQYQKAIDQEYQALDSMDVFSRPCELPAGFIPLDTIMVLRRKEAEVLGEERRFKARLCSKGFRQREGIDYFELYAPVATYDSLRVYLTLMITMDYEIDSVDITTAFLLAPLNEEIYIKIPDGYPQKDKYKGKVLRLRKSLYGLKQAPHDWNKTLDEYLQLIGFKATESEKCIYVGRFGVQGQTVVYLLVYVDDILVACKDRNLMKKIKQKIHQKFPIKDKGPLKYFLNMHFSRDRKARTMSIHLHSKIDSLLSDSRFSEEDRKLISKPCRTPAFNSEVLTKEMCAITTEEEEFMKTKNYKSFLGILLYLSITARPDICTAVSAVARFAQNPGRKHWEALLRILRYLQGTRNYVLILNAKRDIKELFDLSTMAFADADWGTDKDTRRSRSGYAIYMANSLVMWSSKL